MANCYNCGAQLNGGEANCPACGAPQQVSQQPPRQTAPPPPQAPYYPPAYGQAPPPPPGSPYEPVSTGGFIGLILLSMIPLVGLILMIVWAFSATKLSHRNWARANLIISIASTALAIVVIVALGGIVASVLSDWAYYYSY